MRNPWLDVPYQDYENHMSNPDVGQLIVLSQLTQAALQKYEPKTFALLGCCTGNGLEHVDNANTKYVYAVDINSEYLAVTQKRYGAIVNNLKVVQKDIDKDDLDIKEVDLVFAGLFLEYVNIDTAVFKISECLADDGRAVIVLQQNNSANFVSKTNYRSLESLGEIAKEIEEEKLTSLFLKAEMKVIERTEFPLSGGKSFIVLTFSK